MLLQSSPMYVCVKVTGEALAGESGRGWDIEALEAMARRLAELQSNATQLKLDGVIVVIGAGNQMRGAEFARGKNLTPQMRSAADQAGRWATVINANMLSAMMKDLQVPHTLLIAQGMGFSDRAIGDYQTNTPETVQEVCRDGRLVIVAGGTGEDGCSTDAAAAETALAQVQLGSEVMVLKATGHVDGVYSSDPRKAKDGETPKRYDHIYAAQMLKDPERFGIIDERCMRTIAQAPEDKLNLLVYKGVDYSPLEAAKSLLVNQPVGSVILSGAVPSDAPEID